MNLSDPVTDLMRLVGVQKAALQKLGIQTVRDLLFHFPFRYEKGGNEANVAGLVTGAEVSVIGTLEKLETKRSWKRKIPISEGYLRDQTGILKLRWFSQPYIAKMWANGTFVRATGKVSGIGKNLYIANPQLERATLSDMGLFINTNSQTSSVQLFAMYPETRGITSLWFRHAIAKILLHTGRSCMVEDPIPVETLKRYNLPTLDTALVWIHTPQTERDAEAARKRFAFEEVFLIQLERGRERAMQAREKSFTINVTQDELDAFTRAFSFTPTTAQKKCDEQYPR